MVAANSLITSVDTGHEDQIHDCQFDFYGTRLATASRFFIFRSIVILLLYFLKVSDALSRGKIRVSRMSYFVSGVIVNHVSGVITNPPVFAF